MIDYQSIIDIISEMIALALPLGFIFGISEWILNTFLVWFLEKDELEVIINGLELSTINFGSSRYK